MVDQAQPMTSPTTELVHSRRCGVTLLELMLVLALLVVIGSLAFPSIQGALDRQTLRKAGEQIRADLAKARNMAMRSGRIMVWEYQNEGSQYQIRPWAQGSDLIEGDLQTLAASGSTTASAAPVVQPAGPIASATTNYVKSKSLPDGAVFVGANVLQDLRLQSIDPSSQAAPANVPPPIVFYPDGTCSDTQIIIRNRHNHVVIVQLRGLTGSSRLVDRLPDGSLPSLETSTGGGAP